MRRGPTILLLMLALGAGASAQEVPAHTSVGTPQNGRVAGGGVALAPRGPGYHWVTNRGNAGASFGTPSLVAALVRAAAEVARVHPGSDLAIHDLGFERGGRIRGHGSHTSGRDADVAYYATNASGARIDPTTSVWFDPSGRARGAASATAARFDAERTALFLSTLLEDRSIRVQYVFMHPALQRLVRSAAGRHASQLTRVLRTPRGRRVDPHADHLHVRIHCPPADVAYGCADR